MIYSYIRKRIKMKNIYIIGVPGTGKTTLAHLLKEAYPAFNLISFEAVRNAFMKTQPELQMDNRESLTRQEILPSFLIEFLNWNKVFTSYGNILEGDFITIEKLVNYVQKEDIILCLGFSKRSLKEISQGIKSHDREEDYTKDWSIEKIEKHFYNLEATDAANYEACKKYHIPYYDTYEERQATFEKIIKDLKEKGS